MYCRIHSKSPKCFSILYRHPGSAVIVGKTSYRSTGSLSVKLWFICSCKRTACCTLCLSISVCVLFFSSEDWWNINTDNHYGKERCRLVLKEVEVTLWPLFCFFTHFLIWKWSCLNVNENLTSIIGFTIELWWLVD